MICILCRLDKWLDLIIVRRVGPARDLVNNTNTIILTLVQVCTFSGIFLEGFLKARFGSVLFSN